MADAPFQTAVNLLRQGNTTQSLTFLKQAISANPRHAEAHYLLGSLALQQADYTAALEHLQIATRLEKKRYEYFNNLGNALFCFDKLPEAQKAFQQAIRLNPQAAEPFNNLGRTFREQEQTDKAIASLRQAVSLDPLYTEAWNNLASALYDDEQCDEALACVDKALALNGNYYKAINNRGLILEKLDRVEEAEACYRQAATLAPHDPDPLNNLGAALTTLGKPHEALEALRQANKIQPDYYLVNTNLASANFELGNIGEAWDFYEARWQSGKRSVFAKRHQNLPPLLPETDLSQARVIVWREQGIGDELTYSSIIHDLAKKVAHFTFECSPRWLPTFRRSFPYATGNIVELGTIKPNDYLNGQYTHQVPITSLARIFRRQLSDFPATNSFVQPDAARAAKFRAWLDQLGTQPKIGIGWRSQLRNPSRDAHYMAIDEMRELLTIPNVIYINLQYDECSKELEQAKELYGVDIHVCPDLDLKNDLDGNIALSSELDGVISSFNSVAEIAGAVGTPSFVFGYGPGLWATLGSDYVPWLPSVKYYSRKRGEDWNRIAGEIRQDLSSHLALSEQN